MRRYGCFGRADYLPTYQGQDGWTRTGNTALAKVVDIEFTASQRCNYALTGLGRVDPMCEGCARKVVEK